MGKTIWERMGNTLWIPFTLCALAVFWYLTAAQGMDNDGYWILATGRELAKGITKENPFTFVEGLDIVVQQWAWCLVCFKVYQAFGTTGIYVLCVLLSLAVLAVFGKIGALRGMGWEGSLKRGIPMLLCMYSFLSIRPTYLTVLLLLLQVYVTERYVRDGKQGILLALIPIALLECNFHGAVWILHFLFLLPYLVPEVRNPVFPFRKRQFSRKPFLWVVPAMAVTGILNPYGYDGFAYLWRSYGAELKEIGIQELQAPALDDMGLLFVVLLVILAMWIQRAKDQGSAFYSSDCYLLCGTAILGGMHIRNLVYFFVGVLVFSLGLVRTRSVAFRLKHGAGQLSFLAGLMLSGLVLAWIPQALPWEASDSADTPVKAADYLEGKGAEGARIFTTFNAGGYFEYRGFRCFIDARPELYFASVNGKADVFGDYTTLVKSSDAEELEKVLERYGFTYLCIDKDAKFRLYLDMKGYPVAMEGNGYVLYKAPDRP